MASTNGGLSSDYLNREVAADELEKVLAPIENHVVGQSQLLGSPPSSSSRTNNAAASSYNSSNYPPWTGAFGLLILALYISDGIGWTNPKMRPVQVVNPLHTGSFKAISLPTSLRDMLTQSRTVYPLFQFHGRRDVPTHFKYVSMPHDSTIFLRKPGKGGTQQVLRWGLIMSTLFEFKDYLNNQGTRWDGTRLQAVLRDYNPKCAEGNNFGSLKACIDGTPPKMLANLVHHALSIESIIPNRIPILRQNENQAIVMTQHQAFVLLANAFLCTFPEQKTHQDTRNMKLQSFNFGRLFNSESRQATDSKAEKLKCIFSYFDTMLQRPEEAGTILTFERRVLDPSKFPDWRQSRKPLAEIGSEEDTIENGGKGMLQVDFANKFVGGGVLGNGAVMEEIRFSICPELILSTLFTEELAHNEVLVMNGAAQFSKYKGYGHSFTYNGKHYDSHHLDSLGRKTTQIVAMDALQFSASKKYEQFRNAEIDRELNKCYTAFKPLYQDERQKPIASGNWGCGAFNGDPELKFLIQWMAASEAGRKLSCFLMDTQNIFVVFKQFIDLWQTKVLLLVSCTELFKTHPS